MKKRILSLLLSLIMVLSLLPTTAWAKPGGQEPNPNPGGTTTNTVDHIDIAVAITDPTDASKTITLTTELAKTIEIKGSDENVYKPTSYSYSTDNNGNNQIRMNGTFPVGTRNSPVTYTLTLNLAINGVNYTVSVDANYWGDSNVCPGTYGHRGARNDIWTKGEKVVSQSGIDTAFGTPEATTKQVAITKVIAGVAEDDLVAGKTFEFEISQGNTVKGTATVTTTTGQTSVGAIVYLPEGSYTVTEKTRSGYDGYTFKSTTFSPQTLTVGANGGSVTVTNTYEKEVTTGSLTITKANEGDYTPTSVKFTVTGPDSYSREVTLNAASSWTTTLTGLTPGEYTVTENTTAAKPDGYALSATGDGVVKATVTAGGTATANITNTYTKNISTTTNYATLTVTKTGIKADGSYVNGTKENSVLAGVVFTLTKGDQTIDTQTTNANGVAVFGNLDEGTYTLSETAPNGYTVAADQQITVVKTKTEDDQLDGDVYKTVYTCTINNVSNYALEVKNTQITKNITVTKSWNNTDDGYTAPEATSVTVKLLADGQDTGKTVTLSEGTNWKGTFSNLPEYSGSTKITYTVAEVAVPGYTSAVAGDAANGFTITNTPNWSTDETKATLTVIKVDSKDNTTPLAGAKFKLFDAQNQQVGAEQTTGTDGKVTFTDLTGGTYTLKETQAPAGYTAVEEQKTITIVVDRTALRTLKDNNGEITGYEKNTIYKSQTVTVTNTMNEGEDVTVPAKVTITKVDSADSNKKLTGATFTLTSPTGTVLTSAECGNGVYEITGINEVGDWMLSETVAPTGYDGGYTDTIKVASDGGKFALDTSLNKYYTTTTYTIDGKTAYTLTATNTRSTTSISVTKDWDHGDVPADMQPTSVTVKLLADGQDTGKTVTLSADNRWTDTFTGLNTHDDSGKEIAYTAEENTVVGYTGEVTGNADNGYKITNTAKWSGEDAITGATLTIKKVDSEDNTKLLSGAKFTLTDKENPGNTMEATTGADGVASFTELQPGTYMLEEVSAPEGYKENHQVWTVVVTQNQTHTSVTKLTDGTFQKVYDCTVTVYKFVDDELAPLTANNDGSYTITNELAPTEYTAKVDIEKIVEKTGGNVAPGDAKFTFVAMCDGVEKNVGTETIETTGVGTYTGKLTLTVPASAFKLDDNGNGVITLYVEEFKGTSAGWKYDDTVYELVMKVENYVVTYIGFKVESDTPSVLSELIPDGQETNDDNAAVTLSFTNGFSQTTPPSRPNKPGKPSKPITSVKTGDAGVAMYAMSGLLSLGGATLFMKKRKDEE